MSLANEAVSNEVAAMSDEAQAFVQDLIAASEEFRAFESEKEELLGSIGRLRAKCVELHDSEARVHSELGRIYVCANQLSSSISRPYVIFAINEIIANLIGSEEVVILSNESESGGSNQPKVLSQCGIESDWIDRRIRDWACVEEVLQTGASYYAAERDETESIDGEPRTLNACVALRAGERVTGAIAIFHLLPQKQEFTKSDQELCELVASLGGQALYCSDLHERLTQRDE